MIIAQGKSSEYELHTVVALANGQDALNMAKASPSDLNISDIMRPDVHGFKLLYIVKMCKHIRI